MTDKHHYTGEGEDVFAKCEAEQRCGGETGQLVKGSLGAVLTEAFRKSCHTGVNERKKLAVDRTGRGPSCERTVCARALRSG